MRVLTGLRVKHPPVCIPPSAKMVPQPHVVAGRKVQLDLTPVNSSKLHQKNLFSSPSVQGCPGEDFFDSPLSNGSQSYLAEGAESRDTA